MPINAHGSCPTCPAVFVSHGSPMVGIETGPFQNALAEFGARHRPKAIVVVSAHWVSGDDLKNTSAPRLSAIHDFFGFPRRLYELEYNAPGSPNLSKQVESLIGQEGWRVSPDPSRGLDHGAWVPLRFMYPEADIPVLQLSLPLTKSPEEIFSLGKALAVLRKEGVLLLGSGGIVHNLGRVDFMNRDREPEPWAQEFDQWFAENCEKRNYDELFRYQTSAPHARTAVPTPEHFLPVFFALGAGGESAQRTMFEGFTYGTLSMRCFSMGD